MRSHDAGYTLVELLASLIIIGMVSMMMLSGITAGRLTLNKDVKLSVQRAE